MTSKKGKYKFVLIMVIGLFCLGVGIAFMGIGDVDSSNAYAASGDSPSVVTSVWKGTFSSSYVESVSSDITATFAAKPDEVEITINGLSDLSNESSSGTYISTAKSSDPTYTFTNPTWIYTIMSKEVVVVWDGTFESEYGAEIEAISATFEDAPKDVYLSFESLEQLIDSSKDSNYVLNAQIDNPKYKSLNESIANQISDTTAEDRLKDTTAAIVVLVVILAIVCLLIVIVILKTNKKYYENEKAHLAIENNLRKENEELKNQNLKTSKMRYENEKAHLAIENNLRKENEELKNQNDRLLHERDNYISRESQNPSMVSDPVKPEGKPTWREIYAVADELELMSLPNEGETQTEFQRYTEGVASRIKSGICAHGEQIPIIEGETLFDPVYHIQANKEWQPVSGNVILQVIKPGFTINGYVLIKAEVIR